MYGSIRKSYGAKASRGIDNVAPEKEFIKEKKQKEKKRKREDLQTTSYINVEDVRKAKKMNEVSDRYNNTDNEGKSEFPIASVILTIVFTMMVMVIAFGFGGV